MNSRIFKYCLFNLNKPFSDDATVEMPKSATIKHVGLQNSSYGFGIMAWAEVVTDDYKETRKFVVRITGDEIPDNGQHVFTFEHVGLILHLYEIKS